MTLCVFAFMSSACVCVFVHACMYVSEHMHICLRKKGRGWKRKESALHNSSRTLTIESSTTFNKCID